MRWCQQELICSPPKQLSTVQARWPQRAGARLTWISVSYPGRRPSVHASAWRMCSCGTISIVCRTCPSYAPRGIGSSPPGCGDSCAASLSPSVRNAAFRFTGCVTMALSCFLLDYRSTKVRLTALGWGSRAVRAGEIQQRRKRQPTTTEIGFHGFRRRHPTVSVEVTSAGCVFRVIGLVLLDLGPSNGTLVGFQKEGRQGVAKKTPPGGVFTT